MIFVVIGIFLMFCWLIDKADDRIEKRSTKKVERLQKDFYDYIDENWSGYEALVKKEQVEMFIHDYWEHLGRDYKPTGVNEMTTKESRKRLKKMTEDFDNMTELHLLRSAREHDETYAKQAGKTYEQFIADRKELQAGKVKRDDKWLTLEEAEQWDKENPDKAPSKEWGRIW